ncbi:Tetratricopeptide repeat-containing protein [Alkalispirochaeta americana]|uniref:Tetratricopeptide repeat-containing protein n=1 Tax=Alkalispirochaeta americana TaxID=159291 RepID=A0A1N6W150_9SPIO|nr:tetratricopeptide repeat protein [Alkalispirochaeta americana]SIQ83770.1 Tetratricopeptide repeat-containing protein [Alkalispirochaeta americana]
MYRRLLLSLGAVMVLLAVPTVHAGGRDIFEEAERRFAAGNYSLAIERYERLLSDHPGSEFSPRAHFRIGQSHYNLFNYELALDRFQGAALRAPGGPVARQIRFWIGLTHFQLEDYAEAIRAFTRYLEDRPDDPRQIARARLYRGLSLAEQDDPARARDDITAALKDLQGREQGFAIAVLMELLTRFEQNEEILALWESYRGQLSDDDGYQEQRLRFAADAAFSAGKGDLARELYTALVSHSLDAAQWGFQRLYAIAREEGDRGEMQAIFRRAEQRLAAQPQRMSDFWFFLGSEAVAAGRYELAELHLYRVWDLRTEQAVSGEVPFLLARAIERQGRPDEALEILRESLQGEHGKDQAQLQRKLVLARLLIARENPREAVRVMEEVPERQTQARPLYAWTYALYRAGDTSRALTILDRSSSQPLVRELPALMRLRGRLQLDLGHPAEAVRSFREYLGEHPRDGDARIELIRALVGASQFSAASQELQRIDTAQVSPAQQQDLWYLEGLAAFHGRRYERAAELFERVTLESYEPLRSYHFAWSLYRAGQVPQAEGAIASVIEDLPRELFFDGGYLYGWILSQRGRHRESSLQLLRLLAANPPREREIQVRQLLASVYLEKGAYDDALSHYQALPGLATDPVQRAALWSQYGSALALVGQPLEAVAEFDQLHARLGDTPAGKGALLEAGQVLYTEGTLSEARERFRQYQARYPDGPDRDRALYWAGAISLEMGEPARALLWWEPLARDYPRSAFTPRALVETAGIYEERGQRRQALELYDRFVAAHPDHDRAPEAEGNRRRIRLELDGLSAREAELWVLLEPATGDPPPPGSDAWFRAVLELGTIAIREQIVLTSQRNRIVEYLLEGARVDTDEGAQAAILLAEYYRRRGETRAALEQYLRAAGIPGVSSERAAQSLYEVAVLARDEGERAAMEEALEKLLDRFSGSVWADRAKSLMEQNR